MCIFPDAHELFVVCSLYVCCCVYVCARTCVRAICVVCGRVLAWAWVWIRIYIQTIACMLISDGFKFVWHAKQDRKPAAV